MRLDSLHQHVDFCREIDILRHAGRFLLSFLGVDNGIRRWGNRCEDIHIAGSGCRSYRCRNSGRCAGAILVQNP